MKNTLFNVVLGGLLLPFMFGCNSYRDTPIEVGGEDGQQDKYNTIISTLRSSSTALGDEGLYFSVWRKSDNLEQLFTKAPKEGDLWKLQEECIVTEPVFVSATYPNTLIRANESVLIKESDQIPVYFAYLDVDNHSNGSLILNFKKVQSTVSFLFDLSSFPTNSRVESIRFSPRYSYGWLNMQKGVFNRMNTPEYEQITIYRDINKSVAELVDSKGIYKCDLLVMPQTSTYVTVWITIDGIEHYFSVKFDEVKSNTEYAVSVDVFNRGEVVELTPKEKGKSDEYPIPNVEKIFFTDYEFTATHQYMQSLPNNTGVVMNFWLDSRIETQENLEYRLLIKDEAGKVVCASPIYSGLSVKPYHYDGFAVPFYLSVPKEGRYSYQLLLKGNSGKWYEPDQKYDDLPKDKYFEVHPQQNLFVSAMTLHETSGKIHIGTITNINYDEEYISSWFLNNYSARSERVTIKLYNRREPFENHSQMELDNKETWCDKVGEETFEIPAHSSFKADIPYMIKVRRPKVNRYLPYLCATVTYHNPSNDKLITGKEYPLLADGNILYRKTYSLKNPNPFVGSSLVNNKGLISMK